MDSSEHLRNGSPASLPFEESVGYQIRLTHRLFQRNLQQKIEPYGVTLGQWYFLRALWDQDGLTQKELSVVVGTMEPTTLSAIKSMLEAGFVRRVRNPEDNRKMNVYLTDRGHALKHELLPFAREITEDSFDGFSARERESLLTLVGLVQDNLRRRLGVERGPGQSDMDPTF
jgi:DNA-binding MarR family transcriptional regulator